MALGVRFPLAQDIARHGRSNMIATLHFATLAVVTIFAAATAFAFDWMLLRAMFVLMQPATARRPSAPISLARRTTQVTRTYASQR